MARGSALALPVRAQDTEPPTCGRCSARGWLSDDGVDVPVKAAKGQFVCSWILKNAVVTAGNPAVTLFFKGGPPASTGVRALSFCQESG